MGSIAKRKFVKVPPPRTGATTLFLYVSPACTQEPVAYRFSTWLAYSFIFYDATDAVKLDPLLSPAHKLFYGAGIAGPARLQGKESSLSRVSDYPSGGRAVVVCTTPCRFGFRCGR